MFSTGCFQLEGMLCSQQWDNRTFLSSLMGDPDLFVHSWFVQQLCTALKGLRLPSLFTLPSSACGHFSQSAIMLPGWHLLIHAHMPCCHPKAASFSSPILFLLGKEIFLKPPQTFTQVLLSRIRLHSHVLTVRETGREVFGIFSLSRG